jgi:CRISPR-associated protein Cas2
MQEQKLDYSFGYNNKDFKDWDEHGYIVPERVSF